MKSHQNYGFIWETMITEQVIRSFLTKGIRCQFYYYRTQHQAEIDLIIEGKFGLIPIEIKSGITTKAKQIQTLKSFIQEHQCPFGIVVNSSEEIVQLAPNIIQIPAGSL